MEQNEPSGNSLRAARNFLRAAGISCENIWRFQFLAARKKFLAARKKLESEAFCSVFNYDRATGGDNSKFPDPDSILSEFRGDFRGEKGIQTLEKRLKVEIQARKAKASKLKISSISPPI